MLDQQGLRPSAALQSPVGPGWGLGGCPMVLGSFTGLVGTSAFTPTTSGDLLAHLSGSSQEQLQISRAWDKTRGFAGTFCETEGQGFLH